MVSALHKRTEALFIQFAREPISGKVKTRMQPQLSAVQACELHCDLLLWTCEALCAAKLADVELWVAGDIRHPIFERCVAMGVSQLREQRGADLGERMYDAINDGLKRYRKVILVGSDCPEIDACYLRSALVALEYKPLALGPATDGGYVLLGATRIDAGLFRGVAWGQAGVFAQTVARAAVLDESWSQLETLADIDRPQDVALWHAIVRRNAKPAAL